MIYIRFLFPGLKAAVPEAAATVPSFIDDVAIYVESKTVANNIELLTKIVQCAFQWADNNSVQFDDSKTELIHFKTSRKPSCDLMILLNGIMVRPKRELRWLGVWLDRKLNFKGYVQKKVASATSAMHMLLRLLRSEWGLSATSGRQLYIACVTSICDYGAEIWFKNQKQYIEQFQKLQNKAIRKILGVFRTSPISPMEIEANLAPPELRIRQKIKRYAFRIT